mgnify:FL=1
MRIEFKEANGIFDSYRCHSCDEHDWVIETHNGSKTGDLRCKKCGATISEQEYLLQKKIW